MKTLLTALLCILTIGIGLTASATPDTSPDIVVCVDVAPDFDAPVFVSDIAPAPDVWTATDYTDLTPVFTVNITDPTASDPVPLDSSPDEPDALENYLNTLNTTITTDTPLPDDPVLTVATMPYSTHSKDYLCDPDPDLGNPCVTTETTESATTNTDPTAGKSAECNSPNEANADHATTTATATTVSALKPCGN